MPYMAGRTDRQAADAVRRGIEWQYAVSLERTAPGVDFTVWHDLRGRWLAHAAGPRCLDPCLAACNARGWVKARGTHRTDATHVLAAIRTRHRLECVLETLPGALNQRSDVAPAWVPQQVPPAWDPRDGLRSNQARLPTDASTREALARQVGADGSQRLAWGQTAHTSPGLRELPALEALRQIWLQPYDRGTVPGLAALRWRTGDAHPPAAVRSTSPDALEARSCSQRETHGGGSTGHLTETWEPGQPELLTQILTTPATTPACVMGPAIQPDVAERDLLPGIHVLDSGDVDADLLVTAQTPQQIEVSGPPFGSYSRQRRAGEGYALQAVVMDWEAQQARGPPGEMRVHWRPGHEVSGDPVSRLRFDGATCRACPAPSGVHRGERRPTAAHRPAPSPP
jgi:transposase